jgi:hypothetical protein
LKYLFFFCGLFLCGCQYFEKTVPNPDTIADDKIKTIDFKDITTYPSTQLCDTLTDKNAKKDCFYQYISQLIQDKFNEQQSLVQTRDKDTLKVLVTVDYNGEINIKAPEQAIDRAMFDSLFMIQSNQFPKINPATKEGVPVTIQFELPVILKKKI